MGWCSGTDLFDEIVDSTLVLIPLQKRDDWAAKLIKIFHKEDWDCEGDSKYASWIEELERRGKI